MIGHILQIIGMLALVWIGVLVIYHIIVYIVFEFSKNSNWCCITRDTNIYGTEFNEWYIIPTISFYFNFNSHKYPCFRITWLKWIFDMSYHIKRDIEEEAENKAIQELIKRQNESYRL